MRRDLWRRLKALQRAQDVKCAECWDQYIAALLDCILAYERQGVPSDVANRCYETDLTSDEQALLAAAMPHMQAEIEAVKQTYARFAQIESNCGPWLDRRAAADQRSIARHNLLADLTTGP